MKVEAQKYISIVLKYCKVNFVPAHHTCVTPSIENKFQSRILEDVT